MTDPKQPEGEEFQEKEPDTSTDDQPGEEEVEDVKPAFPVAAPVPDSPPAEEETPSVPIPPPYAGPRAFPQHYTLLLGACLVMASGLMVWERAAIFGVAVRGPASVSVSLMFGLALYAVAVGIANIATGRLRGMGITFIVGVMGAWMGIKKALDTWNHDKCLGWSEMNDKLLESGGTNFKLTLYGFLGQWAPGIWLSTLGGVFIVLVFLKAIFGGGGKKKEAPAPTPRRRGRR